MTTPEIARKLGISRQRVAMIAKARGVKPLTTGKGIASTWPKNAVKLLARGKPGRPKNAQ